MKRSGKVLCVRLLLLFDASNGTLHPPVTLLASATAFWEAEQPGVTSTCATDAFLLVKEKSQAGPNGA